MNPKVNSPPKFVVLLAAFNGSKYIAEQIQSILVQDDVSVEIVISVDKSTDATLSICQQYAAAHDNVHLLPYGEVYGSPAKNFFRLLLENPFSDFDYVCFSDQDDIWLPEKLCRAHSIVGLQKMGYSANVLAFWPDGRKRLIKKDYPIREFDFQFESAGAGCTFVLPISVNKLLVDKIRTLDFQSLDIQLHDWFIYAFCRCNKIPWFIDAEYNVLYRQHLGNFVGANSFFHGFFSRVSKVRSGWYRRQVLAIGQGVGYVPISGLKRIFCFWKLRRRLRDSIFLLLFWILQVDR